MKITPYIAIISCLLLNLAVDAQTVIEPHLVGGTNCNPLRLTFSYTTTISPVTSVSWDFGNGNTSTSATPGPISFTPGHDTVTLVLNGTDITRLIIGSPDFTYRHSPDFGSYTIIFEGNNQNTYPPYKYNWVSPDTMLNQSFLIHKYDSAGYYPVKIIFKDTLGLGCVDTLLRLIDVIDTLSIPNVFTPNNDGHNDEFRISANGKDVLMLQVFTRTGILVYKQEASVLIWDGRLTSGDRARPGVYFYIVETKNSRHPFKKSGFFYIFL
jgi:gliding motility-associated-like protein